MTWRNYLKDSVVSLEELENNAYITDEEKEVLTTIVKRHPMRIPKYYYDLIDWKDKDDPIRKLSVPSKSELDVSGDIDTSGESTNTKMPGLQHKYNQTALVLSTNVCFMYCRHCFRKRMVGYSSEEINSRMNETRDYVSSHEEINNVLITGGDAFALSNDVIKSYLDNLCDIEHLDFIRFGTRVPVVFPQRIFMDEELLAMLKEYNEKKKIIIVTQFNHYREITEEAKKAILALSEAGLVVRNQTVLLKGVNDDSDTLAKLLNGLVNVGVHPYYVFQCRPVKYVKSHFQVPFSQGIKIIDETKHKLNGISKGFRYVMSHPRGKIEIFGEYEGKIMFKFHQNKYEEDTNKIFFRKLDDESKWLDPELELIK